MRPTHDPVRSLIYDAGDRAIRTVYVDGRRVVEDGRVLTIDYPAATAGLEEAQQRILAAAPGLDWAHRDVDAIAPPTYPRG